MLPCLTATVIGGKIGSGGSSETIKPSANGDVAAKPIAFHGFILINPTTAKMRLVQVAEEIISILTGDPNAELNITVEINAEFPAGASDQIKRAVTENATSLGFRTKVWE